MKNHGPYLRRRSLDLISLRAFGMLFRPLILVVLGMGLLVVESGQAQNPGKIQPPPRQSKAEAFKVFDVDCDYGTLAFKGTVERSDAGDKYRYRIRIAVVFLPGGNDAGRIYDDQQNQGCRSQSFGYGGDAACRGGQALSKAPPGISPDIGQANRICRGGNYSGPGISDA